MKVVLITGSYPPEVCGIGHYTSRLAHALEEAGAEVEILSGPGWGAKRVLRLIWKLGFRGGDTVHIQYPSEGYGWSLAPQALAMLRPSIVTIHEFHRVHILRKMAILPFLVFGRRLIFTSTYELAVVLKRLPWIAGKCSVIEIGSNIPVPPDIPVRRLDEVIYFGLIAPNKGIEQVIELASLIHRSGLPIKVRVVGATLPRFAEYAGWLKEQSNGLPIDLDLNHDDDDTGRILSGAAIGYLPFPEGASIARGSLKALLASGVAVITTRGPQTSEALADHIVVASSPAEALEIALGLMKEPERLTRLSAAAASYSQTFGWRQIALDHLKVYSTFPR